MGAPIAEARIQLNSIAVAFKLQALPPQSTSMDRSKRAMQQVMPPQRAVCLALLVSGGRGGNSGGLNKHNPFRGFQGQVLPNTLSMNPAA